ncbi:hypothetical protein PROH_08370 [Prochlorothrix hollandica PCC 9006 = CALU 1027]|uniref:Uncharacterized protein n=1 Tax=Prochlorothrix hollandica PCC 9006 = CALU 1027 TaxID=317619 RepID=A0A0M2PXP0_PROHO|nr:hypothetical protein PROH_08370 [Prochlorothrix hollandica PCC 9006 = CALU 1027]
MGTGVGNGSREQEQRRSTPVGTQYRVHRIKKKYKEGISVAIALAPKSTIKIDVSEIDVSDRPPQDNAPAPRTLM